MNQSISDLHIVYIRKVGFSGYIQWVEKDGGS
jgi:hypothetical protein